MNNIWLITKREYLSRVKKKSFIIMTLLGPVLIAAFYGAIIYISVNQELGDDGKLIAVMDQSGLFEERVTEKGKLNFDYLDEAAAQNLNLLEQDKYYGKLVIPPISNFNDLPEFQFESENSLSLQNREQIEDAYADALRQMKMEKMGVSKGLMDSLRTRVSLQSLKIDESGNAESSSIELYTVVGMGMSFAIYIFIFIYGVQVMRGVIEEKTNRIVELIVSTVRPFELMMGKVLGLALVGLTQILIWLILSFILISAIMLSLNAGPEMGQQMQADNPIAQGAVNKLLAPIMNLNFPLIIGGFLFYFIGGYLTYSALFAAVGAAVDSETDTQQFMFPITIPLVFAIVLSTSVIIRDPNGTLSTWLSYIPLTSPIAMMVRIPFEPPMWQVFLSMAILAGFFVFTIWLAGRIYRTGILMYGKKASYRELFRWIRHK
jgi:ABC-2 type transport system permease protein